MTDNQSTDKTAFDYAWGWFSLHAGQRMQSVNFFLIAITFLAASYVSAVVGNRPGLAMGIASLGAFSSFVFYRIERRVRGLIHAAEFALRPIEVRLAAETGIDEIQIVKVAEDTPEGAWKYSKVFRTLYVAVGSAFLLGIFYAGSVKLPPMQLNLNVPQTPRLVAGSVLLIFAYFALKLRNAQANKHQAWIEVVQDLARISLAILAALAAGLILIRISFLG